MKSRPLRLVLLVLFVSFFIVAFAFLSLLIPSFQPHSPHVALRVATFNLWNVMFQWDVRKHKIAQMIHKTRPDIISFQEVLQPSSKNQMEEIQELLPEYKWGVYKASGYNRNIPEGVAILSKLPISAHTFYSLPISQTSPDKNTRILLEATISVNLVGNVNVYATHMSYDRNVQCQHILELIKIVQTQRAQNNIDDWIIAGDLNIYNNHEIPIDILSLQKFDNSQNFDCHFPDLSPNVLETLKHIDVWKALHPNETGLTFSNMPTPGLESRPDRILLHSQKLTPFKIQRFSGKEYGDEYYWNIIWGRMKKIVQNNPECEFDCGPRGKCICGVCVFREKIGNEIDGCESTKNKLFNLLIASVIGFFILISRKRRKFILLALFILILIFVIKTWFGNELKVIFSFLPEELNPSDHYYLVADFELVK